MGQTWALLILAAAWPVFGQSEEAILPSGLTRAAAVADLTAGFNAIGGRAFELSRAMAPNDAAAFDAVMRDVMGALMALPGISSAPPRDQDKFVAKPRPDRIGQLVPDLTGMERFFSRLSQTSETPAKGRMFRRAQKDVAKMLAALPSALPTLDARSSSRTRPEGKEPVRNRASSRQTVMVYLNGDASSLLLGPGKLVASSIFQKIGVRLNWRTEELPASKAAIGIRTARHAPESADGEALAASRLSGAAGVEIMIYEDRLRQFLNAHPSLAGVGVGYVLAHELAHAMQGEARHSESGIMKAHWDTPDFQEMFFQKLAFTAEDVYLIHQGLAARPSRAM